MRSFLADGNSNDVPAVLDYSRRRNGIEGARSDVDNARVPRCRRRIWIVDHSNGVARARKAKTLELTPLLHLVRWGGELFECVEHTAYMPMPQVGTM